MKRILSILTFMLLAMSINAASVTKERARDFAQQFLNTRRINGKQNSASLSPEELTVKPLFDGKLYAVNSKGNGFVIVSGDNRCDMVLGYADNGSFDFESAPAHVKAWLEDYVIQQELIAKGQAIPVKHSVGERAIVEPKLTTQWSQDAPYNNMCVLDKDDGTTVQCVTGCVGTAMAQVLKYHEWPEGPVPAMPAYSPWSNAHMSALPSINFKWENMRVSSFTGNESEEQLNAVAELMRYCGQAINTAYDGSSSGASSEDVVAALTTYFDYDESAHHVYRRNYTIEGWESMIYDELSMNGPVIYFGRASGGGHAVVVDGYDGDGYYHVNWGWGGHCDGYFLLSTMSPGSTDGIGASSTYDGYSIDQRAIVGVHKKDLDAENDSYIAEIQDVSYSGGMYSVSVANFSGHDVDVANAVINSNGDIVRTVSSYTMPTNYGISLKSPESSLVSGLPDGTYRLTGVSKAPAQKTWQLCDGHQLYFAELNVSKGSVKSRTLHPSSSCKLTKVENRGDGLSGHAQDLYVTFTNTGTDDYYGTIDMYVGTSTDIECSTGVSIPAGSSATVMFSYFALQIGNVTLSFKCGETFIGTQTINIKDSGANLNTWIGRCDVQKLELMSDSVTNVLWSNDCVFNFEVFNPTDQTMKRRVTLFVGNYVYGGASSWVDLTLKPKERYTNTMTVTGTGNIGDFFIRIDDGVDYIVKDLQIVTARGGKAVNAAGYKTYIANDSIVPDDATYVDFTYIGGDVAGLRATPSKNPNCVYFLSEDSYAPSWLNGQNVVVGTACANLTLTDGYDFRPKADFTAAKATYTRPMPSRWSTIMLPYDVQSNDDVAFFQPKYIENGMLYLTKLTTLPANTPALVARQGGEAITCSATDVTVSAVDGSVCDVDGIAMRGFYTNNHAVIGDNAYVQQGANQFVKSSDSIVDAFRAYITLSGESLPDALTIFDEFDSAVRDITADAPSVVGYYDALGHRTSSLQKGITLIRLSNGKAIKIAN